MRTNFSSPHDEQSVSYSQGFFVVNRADNDGRMVFQQAQLLPLKEGFHRVTNNHLTEDEQDPDMKTSTIGRVEFWVGVGLSILTVVGAAVTATWSVSNAVSSKNDSLRIELNQNIGTSKQEISDRITRVEDKVDNGFKDVSSQLSDMKVILLTSKDSNKASKN